MPEEQEANSRYLYELASGRFGFAWDKLEKVQAFHFKGGQGAKTGTGGHLPGFKVKGKIAAVRGLEEGQDAISPPRFPEWTDPAQIKDFADEVRDRTGGIPIGYKLSAQHIEKDIDAALAVGVDYLILDGRGGGTGAAPTIFRDNISVPTIPALARARRHLDTSGRQDVSLIITGGLRTSADFIKAMAMGPMQLRCRMRRCRPLAASRCGPAIRISALWGLPRKSRNLRAGLSLKTRPSS